MLNIADIRFEIGAAQAKQFPVSDRPEVVFLGRSNVGKSSLLNTLMGRVHLARVSSTPGKTQQINFFQVGSTYRLVDLPGYGYAKVSQSQRDSWRKLIHAYFASGRKIAIVLQLVDMRHPLQENDADMLAWLMDGEFPVQIVMTKSDKVLQKDRTRTERAMIAAIREQGCGSMPLAFSSVKGTGRKELLSMVLTAVDGLKKVPGEPVLGDQSEETAGDSDHA